LVNSRNISPSEAQAISLRAAVSKQPLNVVPSTKGGNANAMTGTQKAAALMIFLGANVCSDIFRLLTDNEVEKLATEIAIMQHIDHETVSSIIQEFCDMITSEENSIYGGIEYTSDILNKAFGEDISAEKIARIRNSTETSKPLEITPSSIESLRRITQKEHPQTIAVILSSIPKAVASEILSSMPLELQTDIVYRIANLSEVSPDIINQIEDMLKANLQYQKGPKVGGIDIAADLLGHLDSDQGKRIMSSISNTDSKIADKISELMFTYDDIVTITDNSMQRIIQELEEKDLLMALKASTESIKAKFLKNMSQRRRETTEEDLESIPPVKLKDALAAQRKILAVIKELSQSGTIEVIREKDNEAYI